jgi:methylthioribose-1-phosphate isomerase
VAASPASPPVAALRWHDGRLEILDQTRLPAREAWLELHGAQDSAAAILRLAIRGAPNIGIAAAYGLAMQVALAPGDDAVRDAAAVLRAARPTAVNLAWAVDRMLAAVLAVAPAERAAVARAEAEAIHAAEDAASAAIALLGADLLAGSRRILTHCNTGSLACGGTGSALAVVVELARRGDVSVLTCETRPLLQGARLTTWELRRAGIPHELLVDGAAAGLIRRGEVDAVIVGCDRVAANGDVANKVGTYAHALAARAAQIPFVVAGPTSTIDASISSGDEIVIEERAADEVRHAGGALLTTADTPCRNPAFDVTPAELVSALVTERGVAAPPTRASVLALLALPFGRRADAAG